MRCVIKKICITDTVEALALDSSFKKICGGGSYWVIYVNKAEVILLLSL